MTEKSNMQLTRDFLRLCSGRQSITPEGQKAWDAVLARMARCDAQSAQAKDKADYKIGWWLSAALDDPQVCAEMKADINAWFEAHQPGLVMPSAQSNSGAG